jgi:anthranilate synthase component I
MKLEEFRELAKQYDLIPVSREVLFDTNTAVTAYARLKDGPYGFLLESVIGGEKWARYTFLGSTPKEVVRVQAGQISTWTGARGWREYGEGEPLAYLEERLTSVRVAPVAGLPRFIGGAVGYLAYDVVRHIERLPNAPPDPLNLPDAVLMFTDIILVIDNVFGKARIICMADAREDDAYARAHAKIDATIKKLSEPATLSPLSLASVPSPSPSPSTSTYSRENFERDVEKIREYIRAGDAFQVVLSQRLEIAFNSNALDAYRVLRSLNPSPYLYLLELDDMALVGSSPEVLVRVEDRRVVVKPIAGTRRRGRSEEEDLALAAELLGDEKEKAEHLMLVDLGRNDVGRVATFGSVQVTEFMQIERYSHVLHMVTQVEGELRAELSAMAAFRACFPAGTVSGAPKVRAMEIIDELEPARRGPYAGAVGYFGYGGDNMDTAIAIRTLLIKGDRAYVHAGAGIVLDSDPAREYEETLAKAQALIQTVTALI